MIQSSALMLASRLEHLTLALPLKQYAVRVWHSSPVRRCAAFQHPGPYNTSFLMRFGFCTAQDRWPEHVILRSSIIYGPQCAAPVSRTLFLQFIESSLAAGKPTSFFSDEYRCPVYVKVRSRASGLRACICGCSLTMRTRAACCLLALAILHVDLQGAYEFHPARHA